MVEKLNKEELKNSLINMTNAFEQESITENAELIASLRNLYAEKGDERYELKVNMLCSDLQKFVSIPYLEEHPNISVGRDRFIIESIYNGLLSHYLHRVLDFNEDCSGDKRDFIIRSLKEAIVTGTNISLYAVDSNGKRRISSPLAFKDTDEVIAKFRAWWHVK